MARKNNLTSREVFQEFMKLLKKQAEVQKESTEALTKLSGLLHKRMWGMIYLLIVSLLALAGIKLGPSLRDMLVGLIP